MIRNVLAVILGVVAGITLVALGEALGHFIYPPPAGVDFKDPEQLKSLIGTLPIGALLFVIFAWAIASFGGGWLAAFVARQSRLAIALVVGAVLMLFGIINMIWIPHPLWFMVLGVLVFLPSAYAGARLAGAGKNRPS